MSLTATWMEMKNKKVYKNPILFDKAKAELWYICTDDHEPVEFVVFKWKQFSKKERGMALTALLKSLDINASIISHRESGSRLFPPLWEKMQPAISAFIKLNEPLDIDNHEHQYDTMKENIDEIKEQATFYTFP